MLKEARTGASHEFRSDNRGKSPSVKSDIIMDPRRRHNHSPVALPDPSPLEQIRLRPSRQPYSGFPHNKENKESYNNRYMFL